MFTGDLAGFRGSGGMLGGFGSSQGVFGFCIGDFSGFRGAC